MPVLKNTAPVPTVEAFRIWQKLDRERPSRGYPRLPRLRIN